MKGAIFIALNEMVVENHDMGTWLDLLDKSGSSGVFTSTQHYPDQDLISIVTHYCATFDVSPPHVLRAFGEYLFHFLHKAHPVFANSKTDFYSFIDSIDGVIHVEVHKLDANAKPPRIHLTQLSGNEATLSYHSERKLCHLAEGLLLGAAAHYGIKVGIEQTQCMHEGAEHCELKLVSLG